MLGLSLDFGIWISRDPEGVENLTLGDCNGRKIPTQRRDYICRQPEVVNSIVAENMGKWCVRPAQSSNLWEKIDEKCDFGGAKD